MNQGKCYKETHGRIVHTKKATATNRYSKFDVKIA